MNNFSYVGFIVFIGILFAIFYFSNKSEAKKEGKPAESSAKILWIAVVSALAFLGFTVLTGDWN
jgi:prolipoprotein diacylglyceryltransferase